MRIRPRDYQAEATRSIFTYFQNHTEGHPLVAMPTGTGKSVVIADFLDQVFTYYRSQKIMVLTHVKELIEQNHAKLMNIWPEAPAGIYSAGLNKRDAHNNIIFGGIASVVRRVREFGHVDLIIIDEAHLVSPNQKTMYQKFIAALMIVNPNLRVIGLTATPWRLGHGYLTDEGGMFTDICFDITGLHSFNRLIAEGYLAPLVPKKTGAYLDVDGVHMSGGEFIQKELQTAVDKEELTYAALMEAIELGYDRHRWLIFASGIEHAIHVSEMLNSLGIDCGCIHSGNKDYPMSKGQRDQTLADFKSGKIRAVANNNVLTTGIDVPEIDLIIMLRPTASPVLWVQMLGRGTRPLYAEGFDLSNTEQRLFAIQNSQKQNCLVLDFAGNTRRLGPINDPIIPTKKSKKGGTAPVKICPECDTYNHATLKFCTNCGYEFEFKSKLNQEASTEELIKADLPVVEEFPVDHITYSKHMKQGKPDSVKVSYYSKLHMFNEFVGIQHGGNTTRRALDWWRERSEDKAPDTTEGILNATETLRSPTHVRVWTNKKYPEILAFCYDGTGFGKEEPDPLIAPPSTSNAHLIQASRTARAPIDFDDDIPF